MLLVPDFQNNTRDMVYETIEGETVIVDLKRGSYYSLVGAGSLVWQELAAGRTVDEILARLYREYDATPQEMESAVQEFFQTLARENLLAVTETDNTTPPVTAAPTNHHTPDPTKPKFQPPRLQKFDDMQELLLLDPIHEVDETGWPHTAPKP